MVKKLTLANRSTMPAGGSAASGGQSVERSSSAERRLSEAFAPRDRTDSASLGMGRSMSPSNNTTNVSAAIARRRTLNELSGRRKTTSGSSATESVEGGAAAEEQESEEDDGDGDVNRELVAADGPSLVTHLPDVVVQSDHRILIPNQIRMQGVLLFLDISGFTALCEKYTSSGKTGTDQLTKTLNDYMSALCSEMISYDGDILKFAGDAILTMWRITDYISMKAAVEHVIRCSLDIQLKHGNYKTSVGVILKVKVGIAAGEVIFLFVGNDEVRSYMEMGRGIEAVKKAEYMCEQGGDIVLSPTAWIHCSSLVTDHEIMSDGKHVRLRSLISSTGPTYEMKRTIRVTPAMTNLDLSITNLEVPDEAIIDKGSDAGSILSMAQSGESAEPSEMVTEIVKPSGSQTGDGASSNLRRLRKSVITRFSDSTIEKLKLYVAQPVLKKIEERQPLEYLSEMRQVTILFINLILEKCTKFGNQLTMQKCFDIIHENCKRLQGCISKIFLFDKGCTFIVVFGLPGFKHEHDCAHALLCARGIFDSLTQLPKLKLTSIGVTTGPTYCGVVGHNHRHEYTVIGRKANMAARLMMHYPGKVICDNQTFYQSKLHKGNFTVQEMKEMKGLRNVGTVREFRPKANVRETIEELLAEESQRPIIGRDTELKKFDAVLDELQTPTPVSEDNMRTRTVIVSGEAGIGRTRVLDSFIAMSLKRNMRVMSCILTMSDVEKPYNAVTMLLNQLLEFDINVNRNGREHVLRRLFHIDNEEDAQAYRHVLNVLFDTSFQMDGPYDLPEMSEDTFYVFAKRIISKLVEKYAQPNAGLVFAVDDAHRISDASWRLMPLFCARDKTLVVMTIKTPWTTKSDLPEITELVYGPHALMLEIMALDGQYLAALACQLLTVTMIPVRLDRMLRLNSMGVPSWVDLLLREYLYENVIKIEPTLGDYHNEAMVSPAAKYLLESKTRTAGTMSQDLMVSETSSGTKSTFLDTILMSTVSPNAQLICVCPPERLKDVVGVPGSIKGMIQARIDHMEELDQVVLKTASILGQKFTRKMLRHVLQAQVNPERIGESIQRLADAGIFACATKEASGMTTHHRLSALGGETCICPTKDGTQDEKPMRECRFICFQSTSIQVTAYEMMLEVTRRPLHMAAANFLEEQVRQRGGSQNVSTVALFESYFLDDDDDQKTATLAAAAAASGPAAKSLAAVPESYKTHGEEPTATTAEASLGGGTDDGPPSATTSRGRRPSGAGSFKASTDTGESVDDTTSDVVGGQPAADAASPTGGAATTGADSHGAGGGYTTHGASKWRRATDRDPVNRGRLKTIIGPERSSDSGGAGGTGSTSGGLAGNDHSLSSPSVLQNLLAGKRVTIARRSRHSSTLVDGEIDDGVPKGGDDGRLTTDLSESLRVNNNAWESLKVVTQLYPQIVEQYRGAGNVQNTVFYLTEAAAANLALFDPRAAYEHLREVNRIYCDLKRNTNPFEGRVAVIDKWKPEPLDEGTMQILVGQALFDMGEQKKAMPHFRRALRMFGCHQPHSSLQITVAIWREKLLKLKLSRSSSYKESTGLAEARILSAQARCLSYIFQECLSRGDLHYARYAALKQVNKVELADDLHGLIVAYTCMLQLAHRCNDRVLAEEYETKAKIRCVVAMQNVRNDNIVILAQMNWASFEVRLACSGLPDAVEAGLQASRLMSKIRGNRMQVHMLSALAKALIFADRLDDTANIIKQLQVEGACWESMDVYSRCWYFACCIDLVLYVGVRLAPVEDCISYSTEAPSQSPFVEEPMPLFCLACALCVFYKRKRDEGLFEQWRKVAEDREPHRYDCFVSIIGFFQLVECKLLQLSRLLGERRRGSIGIGRRRSTLAAISDEEVRYLESVVRHDFQFIQHAVRRIDVLKPRLMLLLSYHAAMQDRNARARSLLRQCVRQAEAVDNVSEAAWAKHNYQAWFGDKMDRYSGGGEPGDVGVRRSSSRRSSGDPDEAVPPPDQGRARAHRARSTLVHMEDGKTPMNTSNSAGGTGEDDDAAEEEEATAGNAIRDDESTDDAQASKRPPRSMMRPAAQHSGPTTTTEESHDERQVTINDAPADDAAGGPLQSPYAAGSSPHAGETRRSSRSRSIADWMLEQGLARASARGSDAADADRNRWMQNATGGDFPNLNIFANLVGETPAALKYCLPLPSWFTINMFLPSGAVGQPEMSMSRSRRM